MISVKYPDFVLRPLLSLRAILYLSHGAGEHMGRYEKLKDVLVESGILVYGHDHGERGM